MNITLRAGERLFINGAVIRVDRKASIELLNDVTFLLENHVLQAEQATTPIRQIYFAVQIMLMDPTAAASAAAVARPLIDSALAAYRRPIDRRPARRRRVARPRAKFRGAEDASGPVSARGQGTRAARRNAERRVNKEHAMTVTATTPVSNSAATSSASSAAAAATTQSLSYNDFLTLLMAEMKNQDPTQPMDPSQMVSQLATVSEVGQAVQTNTTLASLLTSTSLGQAEQLVGQTITSSDGSTSGQVASVSVTSSGAVATLTNGSTVSLANGASVQ